MTNCLQCYCWHYQYNPLDGCCVYAIDCMDNDDWLNIPNDLPYDCPLKTLPEYKNLRRD